jgi:regulator of protease activity HflC (stomatin/prohibitin superfamily)
MFEEFARLLVWLLFIIILAGIILPQMIRILREYERGVIFRLGKLLGTKGPGDLAGKVPSLVNHGRFTFDSERELKAGDTLEISISPA